MNEEIQQNKGASPSKTPYIIVMLIGWGILGWYFAPTIYSALQPSPDSWGLGGLAALFGIAAFGVGLVFVAAVAGVVYKIVNKNANREARTTEQIIEHHKIRILAGAIFLIIAFVFKILNPWYIGFLLFPLCFIAGLIFILSGSVQILLTRSKANKDKKS